MSGSLSLAWTLSALIAGQSLVSGLPSEMKTVLAAEVRLEGASVLVDNRSEAVWRRCRVTLNDRYRQAIDEIAAGTPKALPLAAFTDGGGAAFQAELEPVYDLFIDCRWAPEVRGIALFQAPDRARLMVVEAQQLLARQGYDPGPPDGQLGPRTQAAIRDFQEAGGYDPSGQVDTTLLNALREGAAGN
ncbi:MAG: peptidoglycan-binding domain-containing protein [Pseudomonadota bacterium]